MVCRPASQFCCGCSVSFGVKTVLLLHFLQTLYYVVSAVFDIVFNNPSISYSSNPALESAICGFALAGLPIICLAAWGMWQGLETPLRLYFLYLLLSCVLDVIFMAKELILSGPCSNLPGLVQDARAFACGAARFMDAGTVILLLGIQMYFLFIVQSHCEDLRHSPGSDSLDKLAADIESKKKKAALHGYGFGNGDPVRFHTKGDGYGTVYEATAANGLGGSPTLFGGTEHELNFPPRGY